MKNLGFLPQKKENCTPRAEPSLTHAEANVARAKRVTRADFQSRTGRAEFNTDRAKQFARVSIGFARGVFLQFSRGVQISTGQAWFSTGHVIFFLLR